MCPWQATKSATYRHNAGLFDRARSRARVRALSSSSIPNDSIWVYGAFALHRFRFCGRIWLAVVVRAALRSPDALEPRLNLLCVTLI